MAEKKKFEKPEMKEVKLDEKISVIAASGKCYWDSSDPSSPSYCPENG